MSQFDVQAYPLTISPHPDPEVNRIELASIGGYVSVVPKGKFNTGDLAVYIPEQSIVPLNILQELGLTKDGIGSLSGKDGQRVKAVRFRGILSQGLLYVPPGVELHELVDYGDALGIVKWVPPIPMSMSGDVVAVPDLKTYTDIENIKKFMDVFEPGEEVVVTEKLHGSCCIGSLIEGEFFVSSKGLAGKGLAIKHDEIEDGRTKNLYWRALENVKAESALGFLAKADEAAEVTLFGEVLGVQDLMYGLKKGELSFRAFDLRIEGEYANYYDFREWMDGTGIPRVPVLYKGPYDYEKIRELSEGQSTIANHIREGVVIKPITERHNTWTGRTILKSVSDTYLLRKNATEYE